MYKIEGIKNSIVSVSPSKSLLNKAYSILIEGTWILTLDRKRKTQKGKFLFEKIIKAMIISFGKIGTGSKQKIILDPVKSSGISPYEDA